VKTEGADPMDSKYRELLEEAQEYSEKYVEGVASMPAFPDEEGLSALDEFDEPMPEQSTDAMEVIRRLEKAGSATVAQIGGRCFGFVNGSVLPAAHAAEWIADTWNQNGSLYVMSPAVSKIEDVCEKWIVDLFGLPEGTAMGLVTGSSNAIICALAAARNEMYRRQGYDLSAEGFRNAPKIRVVAGEGAHSAVFAALSVLGIGKNEVEIVPDDECGRMKPECLPELDDKTILILQAGHVTGGHFDPFDEICEKANKAGAWVHIDGAFGLWAAASEKQKHLTKGIDKADSFSVDAHKTLNAGYDCGIVLCRDRDALASALQASGAYIEYGENRDGMLYTTEMSRRGRALPLWAVLKQLGKSGVEQLIDQLCDNAEYFVRGLEAAGFTVPVPPCFNQGMVRCGTPEQTRAVLERIQHSGDCFCSGSQWDGVPVIRISVCSYATTKEDIDRSIEVFKKALAETV
jgi:glutamate/tyrosine decarboxylase-like PLP-dependent enzyme